MFGSLKILNVRGIPIRVHFTLLLALPWFVSRYSKGLELPWLWGAVTVMGLFTSVALHELGHSFTAMAKGVRTSEIILTPIGGIARLARIPSRGRDELQIALAGPLVSLGLAAVLGAVVFLTYRHIAASATLVLFLLCTSNALLAGFNLLPCFPMDGGRVYRALLTKRWGRIEATRRAVKLGGWFAAGLFALGLWSMNIFTMIIAWFVYSSAQSEYRMVIAQETAQRMSPFGPMWGPPSDPGHEVEISVSPSPYDRR